MRSLNWKEAPAQDRVLFENRSEVQLARIYEPDPGLFMAESPNVILRALAGGYEPVAVLALSKVLEAPENSELLAELEKWTSVRVYTADEGEMSHLPGFELTRGILCAMKRRKMTDVADILTNARRIVVLDEVMNPTNVGAIFRSAAALNMDAVLLTKGCSDPLYRRSARVSMGTVFQIPWTYLVSDPDGREDYIDVLRNRFDFRCIAMALRENTVDIDDPILKREERLAILMGSEGPGLPLSTIQKCDYTVKIPMSHRVDSLNVGAAAAIAFWEVGK